MSEPHLHTHYFSWRLRRREAGSACSATACPAWICWHVATFCFAPSLVAASAVLHLPLPPLQSGGRVVLPQGERGKCFLFLGGDAGSTREGRCLQAPVLDSSTSTRVLPFHTPPSAERNLQWGLFPSRDGQDFADRESEWRCTLLTGFPHSPRAPIIHQS